MIKEPLQSGLDTGFGTEWSKEHSITAGAIDAAVAPPIVSLQGRVTVLEAEVAALTGQIPGLLSQISSLQSQVAATQAALDHIPPPSIPTIPANPTPPENPIPASSGSDTSHPITPPHVPFF